MAQRYLACLAVSICILGLWLVGCQTQTKQLIQQQPVSEKDRLAFLRAKIQLTPLIEIWHYQLEDQNIRQLFILEDLLLVETESHKVYAFDRHKGVVKWVYQVGEMLDYAPAYNKTGLFLVTKGKLHILVKSRGALIVKRNLPFAPSSAPFATNEHVFIGGWDGFLYALNPRTGYRDWRYRIDGKIMGAAVCKASKLFFPGTDERVYAIAEITGQAMKDWGHGGTFSSFDANQVDLVLDEKHNNLYIASLDFNLYAVNWVTGNLSWKIESGGPLEKPLDMTDTTLYVVSRRGPFGSNKTVLLAIDTGKGKEKWQIQDGQGLFFKGKYHDWILLKNRRVAAVHPAKGTVRDNYNLRAFQCFTHNSHDDQGYAATRDGWIFALTEK